MYYPPPPPPPCRCYFFTFKPRTTRDRDDRFTNRTSTRLFFCRFSFIEWKLWWHCWLHFYCLWFLCHQILMRWKTSTFLSHTCSPLFVQPFYCRKAFSLSLYFSFSVCSCSLIRAILFHSLSLSPPLSRMFLCFQLTPSFHGPFVLLLSLSLYAQFFSLFFLSIPPPISSSAFLLLSFLYSSFLLFFLSHTHSTRSLSFTSPSSSSLVFHPMHPNKKWGVSSENVVAVDDVVVVVVVVVAASSSFCSCCEDSPSFFWMLFTQTSVDWFYWAERGREDCGSDVIAPEKHQ